LFGILTSIQEKNNMIKRYLGCISVTIAFNQKFIILEINSTYMYNV